VGKTCLAEHLSRVLPHAVRAKLGHAAPRAGGPDNYFQQPGELEAFVARLVGPCAHVLVEANAWAGAGRGDVIVFLDDGGTDARRRPDADALAARAHIRVGGSDGPDQWTAVLDNWLPQEELRGRVLEVMRAQHEFLVTRARAGHGRTGRQALPAADG